MVVATVEAWWVVAAERQSMTPWWPWAQAKGRFAWRGPVTIDAAAEGIATAIASAGTHRREIVSQNRPWMAESGPWYATHSQLMGQKGATRPLLATQVQFGGEKLLECLHKL
jgi:hypothetical protein